MNSVLLRRSPSPSWMASLGAQFLQGRAWSPEIPHRRGGEGRIGNQEDQSPEQRWRPKGINGAMQRPGPTGAWGEPGRDSR